MHPTIDLGFLFDSNTKRQISAILNKKEKTMYNTHILINPENYTIKKGDIGYVICDEYEIVKEALNITSSDSPEFQNFQSNLQKLDQRQTPEFDSYLTEMYANL